MDHPVSPHPVFDLVCIGNYTRDTILSPAGVRQVDGGAMNYAAHAAARLGLKVAVVTRLAQEDDRVIQKLSAAGVTPFVTYTSQSTCIRLEYPTADPDQRRLAVTSTAGSIGAGEVAPVQARAAVIGATLRGEVGGEVIRALHERRLLVAADMQGYVRVLRGQDLVYEPWPELGLWLPYLDILKADAVEAEFLTGESDLHRAAEAFAALGPSEIVLTHRDGVLVYARGRFYTAGFYPQRLDGRSGRGDTCLGAYTGLRLSKPPAEAAVWAAAVTSLKMEHPGPFDRSLEELTRFIRERYGPGGG